MMVFGPVRAFREMVRMHPRGHLPHCLCNGRRRSARFKVAGSPMQGHHDTGKERGDCAVGRYDLPVEIHHGDLFLNLTSDR